MSAKQLKAGTKLNSVRTGWQRWGRKLVHEENKKGWTAAKKTQDKLAEKGSSTRFKQAGRGGKTMGSGCDTLGKDRQSKQVWRHIWLGQVITPSTGSWGQEVTWNNERESWTTQKMKKEGGDNTKTLDFLQDAGRSYWEEGNDKKWLLHNEIMAAVELDVISHSWPHCLTVLWILSSLQNSVNRLASWLTCREKTVSK